MYMGVFLLLTAEAHKSDISLRNTQIGWRDRQN